MYQRRLALLLALAALTPTARATDDDVPGYGDLGVVETTTRTRDEHHRLFPVDTQRLDGDLQRLEETLEEAFGLWEQIVTASERTLYEGATSPRQPSIVLHFWDPDRYSQAQQTGTELATSMHEAQRLARRIGAFFDENAANRPELYVQLLERHAKVLELYTVFNTLLDWGTSRNLTFNTSVPFDQREVWILEPTQYEHLTFPVLPRIVQSTGVTASERSAEEMGGMAVERSATVVTTSRTTFLQALSPDVVAPWLVRAQTLAQEATRAKARIRSLARSEQESREVRRTRQIRVGSQEDFDAAKAQAQAFARALTHLKAHRNAALSLLSGSDLLMAHEDLAADWQSTRNQYETLARWGEDTYIQYDGLGVAERNQTIFHQEDFTKRHSFEPAPKAPEGEGVGEGVAGEGVTADQVYRALAARPTYQRDELARALIPRIRSLSLDQLSNIAGLMNRGKQDNVLSFGMRYVNR